MTASTGFSSADRRQNDELRNLFDTAYVMIEPFFDAEAGWGGQALEHLAFRILHENFPTLSSAEVHAIIVAAHRIFIDRNPEASGHLKSPVQLKRS